MHLYALAYIYITLHAVHLPSQFLDGKKHGRGRYLEACGNKYEGPYVHDKMHGEHGTCTYANENVYSGSFDQAEQTARCRPICSRLG